MRASLTAHPDFPCDAVTGIEVGIERPSPVTVALSYVVTGRIGDLLLPAPAAPIRTDELWRTTCFEAFVRPDGGEAYAEFNFAPSTRWAAYSFTGYREGMADRDIPAPVIVVRKTERILELQVSIPVATPARLALSAIFEETNGRKSYWALAHPAARPDFHHAAGFAYELGA